MSKKTKDTDGLCIAGFTVSLFSLAAMFIVSWNENGSHREARGDAATREVRDRSGEDDDEDITDDVNVIVETGGTLQL